MAYKLPYLGAVFCAVALIGAVKPAAAGPYGALATSPQADFGYSYNYDDAEEARRRALVECAQHSSECQVKGTFQDTCVSIAKASNGAMGWAWGHGRGEDERLAMSECNNNKGDNCQISRRFCTGNP